MRRHLEETNPILLGVGFVCVVVATVGLFLKSNAALCGTFLFLGVATLIIAVFEARMEGPFEIGPTRLAANLSQQINRSARSADEELKQRQVRSVDDVVERR